MGGAACIIPGVLLEERLAPMPRKKSLLDKLLGRRRYDKPVYSDFGDKTFIEVPPGDLPRKLTTRFKEYLSERLDKKWPATESFFEYLFPRVGFSVIDVFLRGEKTAEVTQWYVQISFSACAGMADVSALLASHWAEIWVKDDFAYISENIMKPEGFNASDELEPFDEAVRYVPVGTDELSVYAAFYPAADADNTSEFEIDCAWLEQHDDEDELMLDLRNKLELVMADGQCRCQLCMPQYEMIYTRQI